MTQATRGASADAPAKLYGLLAEFESTADIMAAAEKTREAGYRWWDCMTPFPVHGLDKAMGVKPTILPILVFGGGITGTILAFVLQWFTNASSFDMFSGIPGIFVRGYDFMISGKPFWSGPAWVPIMFELTILLSALGCVGWMFLLNGLPRFFHPCVRSERFSRVTDDRFFLVIEARDPKFVRHKTEDFLRSLEPLSLEALDA
jgi:hypothetical protein